MKLEEALQNIGKADYICYGNIPQQKPYMRVVIEAKIAKKMMHKSSS